jgi:hypothetical protein
MKAWTHRKSLEGTRGPATCTSTEVRTDGFERVSQGSLRACRKSALNLVERKGTRTQLSANTGGFEPRKGTRAKFVAGPEENVVSLSQEVVR